MKKVRFGDLHRFTPLSANDGYDRGVPLDRAPQIRSNTFDCVILQQTLQSIYDTRAVVRTLHRILKPGGVALVTVPGISRMFDETPVRRRVRRAERARKEHRHGAVRVQSRR